VFGLGLAGAGFAAGSYIRDNKRQRHDSALEPVPHAAGSKHKRSQQQQHNNGARDEHSHDEREERDSSSGYSEEISTAGLAPLQADVTAKAYLDVTAGDHQLGRIVIGKGLHVVCMMHHTHTRAHVADAIIVALSLQHSRNSSFSVDMPTH
jgi:hypothetical protein